MNERFTVVIEADKTGPQPAPGEPWPTRGLRIVGEPPETLLLPVSFVKKNSGAAWLTVEDPEVVQRPSEPGAISVSGSAGVAPEHLLATNQPHTFVHASRIVFHTLDGDVSYEVVRQPDKYVAGDESGKQKVTVEIYDAGDTEVEHFYTCKLEA